MIVNVNNKDVYTIGVDYRTLPNRMGVVCVADGAELAAAECSYPRDDRQRTARRGPVPASFPPAPARRRREGQPSQRCLTPRRRLLLLAASQSLYGKELCLSQAYYHLVKFSR